jgi:hypothetical protein
LSEFSGAVAPEAAFVLDSGIADLLRASEDAEGTSETIPVVSRGFNGKRSDEGPSMRAKRLRIERGEQSLPTHVVASIGFGIGRYVACECGWRTDGQSSDREMDSEWRRHASLFSTIRPMTGTFPNVR